MTDQETFVSTPFTPQDLTNLKDFSHNKPTPLDLQEREILRPKIFDTMHSFYVHTVQRNPEAYFREFFREPVDSSQYMMSYGVCPNFGIRLDDTYQDGLCHFILTSTNALSNAYYRELGDTKTNFIRCGAQISFEILTPNEVNFVKARCSTINFEESDLGSIYVCQLQQGRWYDSLQGIPKIVQNETWANFYDGIKWERLLLMTVVRWAKFVGFTSVIVEPGWANRWVIRHDESDMKRFKLRYDVTAHRCGFRQKTPNSPFRLNI